MTKVQIHIGALAPPLHEQLAVPPEVLDQQQQDIDALIRLRVRGVIPSSVARRGESKVIKEVTKIVEEYQHGGKAL